MTLNEFINHLKHKTIGLAIFYRGKIIYTGTVGSYVHWANRSKFDNYGIDKIIPYKPDVLVISISKA